MDVVQTRQCPELQTFIKKKLGKRIDYREIGNTFGVGLSNLSKSEYSDH